MFDSTTIERQVVSPRDSDPIRQIQPCYPQRSWRHVHVVLLSTGNYTLSTKNIPQYWLLVALDIFRERFKLYNYFNTTLSFEIL